MVTYNMVSGFFFHQVFLYLKTLVFIDTNHQCCFWFYPHAVGAPDVDSSLLSMIHFSRLGPPADDTFALSTAKGGYGMVALLLSWTRAWPPKAAPSSRRPLQRQKLPLNRVLNVKKNQAHNTPKHLSCAAVLFLFYENVNHVSSSSLVGNFTFS